MTLATKNFRPWGKKYFGSLKNGCIFALAFKERTEVLKGSARTLKRMGKLR